MFQGREGEKKGKVCVELELGVHGFARVNMVIVYVVSVYNMNSSARIKNGNSIFCISL